MGSYAATTAIPQGKIAVMRTGDGTLAHGVGNGVGQDFTYVDVYDTLTNNQAAPLFTYAIPTNVLWINGHAGTEGQGISRSADHSTLALAGYTGPMNYPASTPSSSFTTNNGVISASFTRGFGLLDPISGTNFNLIYSGYSWFGLPTGVTQNNPTGIATPDGTNFYGTGNVTPTGSTAAGGVQYLLYETNGYNDGNIESGTPYPVSPYPSGAGEARIFNGQVYIIATAKKGGGNTTNGIYYFVDPNNLATVPLPDDPFVPNPVEHIVTTNLLINFDLVASQPKLAPLSFDMNTNLTVLYAADQQYGIFKFVNNGGGWAQAYYYSPTNLGTLPTSAANQGIFSICVDFSGVNPVIYATTMENGTLSGYNNAQGNPNQNRLLRIVDTGSAPGTNLVAQTLAQAISTNISFRGIDFTPDLRPYFLSAPANVTTTNNGSATFAAPATAPSSLGITYQWYQNTNTLLSGQTTSTLTISSLLTSQSGNTYDCVATDDYGSVTSTVATLSVNFVAQSPTITNSVANVSANVNDTVTFGSISPVGTTPFAFQWYFGTTALSDASGKYTNSQTSALTIFNATTADSGNYYLVASNIKAPPASNLVDVLTVSYVAPVIGVQPTPVTSFVGTSVSLSATVTAGTTPLTYQWYQNGSPLSDPGSDGDFSGSQTSTLTISPAALADSGTYYLAVTNASGQGTNSSSVLVTITPAPPLSFVSYSNGLYFQDFNSLPYEANRSINAFNNPESADSISNVAYSVANPFDFAYPVLTSGYLGGLGLSNTMSGWYGAGGSVSEYPGVYAQIGAGDGDQTTGGDLFFGNLGATAGNRALGLQTTSSVGPTAFALKLINTGNNTLNYMTVSFTAEQWRRSTRETAMSVGYTNDPTANSFSLVGGDSISNSTLIPGLGFSFSNAANASLDTALDGTLAANQKPMAVYNYPISPAWAPGSALWLIWGLDFPGAAGKGQGYAIDNLSFSASVNPAPVFTLLTGTSYSSSTGLSFTFTNLPGFGFTVYKSTGLNPASWVSIGHPTETVGSPFSTYSFTDAQAANNPEGFYKITSP